MNQTPEQLRFAAHVKENRRLIYKAINAYCDDIGYHDDLFQDIILSAWKTFPKFRNDCKFSTWIYQIAERTACARLQILKNKIKYVALDNIFYEIESVPYEEIKLPSLSDLSQRERRTIELRIEGKSYHEMSLILNEPEGRLRVRVTRIIDRLKSHNPLII